ncbi:MAG: FAD-binding oxidoreductase [Candidatus Omnitrophica bacterium]|nr:FAD-binding oxidoreductase [Candidatus Omnitrophota bacterium]
MPPLITIPSTLDTEKLASLLRSQLEGEVCFDSGTRAIYAHDASNYRQVPIGVVMPKSIQDVIQTIEICRELHAPVLTRGAGTSIAGQSCNIAVILDFSPHLNQILEISPEKKTARIEPGLILDQLNKKLKPLGLIFGPDPATHSRCTLGGMMGNNSCGIHSLTSGKTAENVESLEILTYDGCRMHVGATPDWKLEELIRKGGREGEIYSKLKKLRDQYAELIRRRYPKLSRRVSGYNLDQLLPENGFHVARSLVGTEGTCVTILNATLNLVEDPPHKNLLVLGYPDVYAAADDSVLVCQFKPEGFEGLDENFIGNMRIKGMHALTLPKFSEGKSWSLIEFGGKSQAEAREKAEKLIEALKKSSHPPTVKLFEDPKEVHAMWAVRESAFGATVFVPGQKDIFAGWEDAAVPPENLGTYLREFNRLIRKYHYETVVYGHFGEGCIHSRVSFDFKSPKGIQEYRSFINDSADLVLKLGGSLSGEHGDGQARAELLPKMFGEELVQGFREFKSIWDPENKMNPGKVVNAYRMDENLKYIDHAKMNSEKLHFSFSEDQGDFFKTTQRCIGIGRCRRPEDGLMCPSYMATKEEKHSTRGRAHLLYEMMRGEVLTNGWKEEAVKESLDLCLACKGCKTECPTNVDIATYKSEFLSHYYEHHRRPLRAYLLGYIHRGAKLASKIPRLANFLTQTPGLRHFLQAIAGLSIKRRLPAFACQTFQAWAKNHKREDSSPRPKVLLWPDTFSNYFYPEIGKAAVRVLEKSGYEVIIPQANVCCGRPLYDFGFLDEAKARLIHTMKELKPFLDQGIPIIGLEPSCVSVFRDELLGLFPNHPEARKLASQTFLFGEFLGKQKPKLNLRKPADQILIHGHCHQKSVLGDDNHKELFQHLGLNAEALATGCCGMAGAFGFEREHEAISIKIAEKDLFPKIRERKNIALISDGFSCREQIKSGTDHRPKHLAEFLDDWIEK